MIDDEKIIEMFFGRSEQGIRELDIKYGKVCHNLSYHIVGSRQDAEECVNDAYLGAWNAIPPARPNPLLSYRQLHHNRTADNDSRAEGKCGTDAGGKAHHCFLLSASNGLLSRGPR